MYSPVKVIEVFLWGRRVGALFPDSDQYSVFEYDPEFRKSGIEVAPFMMPLGRAVYHAFEHWLIKFSPLGMEEAGEKEYRIHLQAKAAGIGTAKRVLGEVKAAVSDISTKTEAK